jgi:hypothetical protein
MAAGRALALFLGSNIGNFDRPARAFEGFAPACGAATPAVGADLVKPDAICCWRMTIRPRHRRVQPQPARQPNRELGGDFDVDQSSIAVGRTVPC